MRSAATEILGSGTFATFVSMTTCVTNICVVKECITNRTMPVVEGVPL